MALSSEQESQSKGSTQTVMRATIDSLSRVMRRLASAFRLSGVSAAEFGVSMERFSESMVRLESTVHNFGETESDNMASINDEQLMSELVDYSSIVTDSPQLNEVTVSGTTGDWNVTSDQWVYVTDGTAPWPRSEIEVGAPFPATTTVPQWVWSQENFTHSQGDANMREVELLGTLSKITGLDFRSMLSLFTRVGSATKVQREKAIEQFSQAIVQYAVNGQFNVWQRAYAILLIRGRNAGYFLFGEDIEPTKFLEFEIHKMNQEMGAVRKIRIGPFIPEKREKIEFHRMDPIVCPDTEYTIHLYSTDEDLYVRESNFYRKKEN